MRAIFLAFPIVCTLLAACAPDADSFSGEEPASSSEDELSTAANTNYYIVTRSDTRRCAAPLCGGVYVKKVNAAQTACADGTLSADCYTESIDSSQIGLTGSDLNGFESALVQGRAVIRARRTSRVAGGTRLGTLVVQEGWIAMGTASPQGTFVRASSLNGACSAPSCEKVRVNKLNATISANVTDILLSATGAVQADIAAAKSELTSSDGFLAAGYLVGSPPYSFGATQFYLLAVASPIVPAGRICGGRSLSTCPSGQDCIWKASDICGATDAPGRCEVRPRSCSSVYRPVCGCDGISYQNECLARSAGTSVARSTACDD
jgi:Kazal-type serine protease inhibitor domain